MTKSTGAPLGTVIAYKCPDVQVTIVDKDKRRIEAWNSDILPMYEPGLENMVFDIRRQRRQTTPELGASMTTAKKQDDEKNGHSVDHTVGTCTWASAAASNSNSKPVCNGTLGEYDCNLSFSTDVERAIDEAEIIFLCIDTPTKAYGEGKGTALNIANIEAAVKTIAQVSKTDKVIVEKSTVPCGTAEMITDLVNITTLFLLLLLPPPLFFYQRLIYSE